MNGDVTYATEDVVAGEKVSAAAIDTDPAKDYYDFRGWTSDGGTMVLSAADVRKVEVNAAMTYTAVFTPKTYNVTKAAMQAESDAATATYNTDYTGTISGYDTTHAYTVSYTVGGGTATAVTPGSDGTFTIPGANIK